VVSAVVAVHHASLQHIHLHMPTANTGGPNSGTMLALARAQRQYPNLTFTSSDVSVWDVGAAFDEEEVGSGRLMCLFAWDALSARRAPFRLSEHREPLPAQSVLNVLKCAVLLFKQCHGRVTGPAEQGSTGPLQRAGAARRGKKDNCGASWSQLKSVAGRLVQQHAPENWNITSGRSKERGQRVGGRVKNTTGKHVVGGSATGSAPHRQLPAGQAAFV